MTEQATSKKERDREFLAQMLAAKGNVRPPSTDLSAILAQAEKDQAEKEVTPPVPPDAAATTPAAQEKRITSKAKPAAPAVVVKVKPAVKQEPPAPPAETPAPHVHIRQTDVPAQEAAAEDEVPATPAAPWANAHPKVTSPYLVRLPEELHMKLLWLAKNLPSTSMNKLILSAVQDRTEELLAEHYQAPAKE